MSTFLSVENIFPYLMAECSVLAGFKLYVGIFSLHHGPDELPAIVSNSGVMEKIVEKDLMNQSDQNAEGGRIAYVIELKTFALIDRPEIWNVRAGFV